MHLLVAEDDAKLCEVLFRGLRGAGYSVDVAARGDEAFELLLLNTYDAAVVDWRMPAMDGIEVVTAVRSRGLSLPVLMLTARDTPSDRIRGLDAGCDDYLVKPFDFAELLLVAGAVFLLARDFFSMAIMFLQFYLTALRISLVQVESQTRCLPTTIVKLLKTNARVKTICRTRPNRPCTDLRGG